jgi:hypothetical protein
LTHRTQHGTRNTLKFMQPIILPVSREVIKNELTEERFVRQTRAGGNKIYIINHHNAPNTMREIGRLRELSFRAGGGGTGEAFDIDEHDTCPVPYQQLIVWNDAEEEIVGGYRYICCSDALQDDGSFNLSTAHYFHFSEQFKKDFLPLTIELGRSWVQPNFQPSAGNRKGLFSLDNLWDGLGALMVANPHIRYFFGKVTMYPHYNSEARDLLMAFMQCYFPDPDRLLWPIQPLQYAHDMVAFRALFDGLEYKDAYRILNQRVRGLGENIPPLINSYMNLSPNMRVFGTCVNTDFGAVEETGILINIDDIYDEKKRRHMEENLANINLHNASM